MSRRESLYYWDASVFIHLIQQTAEYYDILRSIVDQAKLGRVKLVSSFLTLPEVIKLRSDSGRLSDQDGAILDELFENDYVNLRTLDRRVGEKAREIRRYHRLDTADAIHVATAILYEVEVLHTYDRDILGWSGRIGTPHLRIEKPKGPVQKRIDFPEDANPYVI